MTFRYSSITNLGVLSVSLFSLVLTTAAAEARAAILNVEDKFYFEFRDWFSVDVKL